MSICNIIKKPFEIMYDAVDNYIRKEIEFHKGNPNLSYLCSNKHMLRTPIDYGLIEEIRFKKR
jgi:hypothetical protein